ENYGSAVYKALAIQSFKGSAKGETIYFGPYVGMGLGTEYIVFLHNTKNPITPKTSSSSGYGRIQYAEVFNQGYSAMKISYECVFEKKEPAQNCDYAVRVCTDYIVLPKSIHAFPPQSEATPFGCQWVRKTSFTELLRSQSVTSRR